jgi:hypothetical protein
MKLKNTENLVKLYEDTNNETNDQVLKFDPNRTTAIQGLTTIDVNMMSQNAFNAPHHCQRTRPPTLQVINDNSAATPDAGMAHDSLLALVRFLAEQDAIAHHHLSKQGGR